MDQQLLNTATSTGNYNGISTPLTSQTLTTNMISGLNITKTADKQNWVDGYLTYTIVINNQASQSYTTPVITDVIDTTKVSFVDGSVTIDGISATSEQYSYNTETHTLTVTLTDIATTTSKTITFQVEKAS